MQQLSIYQHIPVSMYIHRCSNYLSISTSLFRCASINAATIYLSAHTCFDVNPSMQQLFISHQHIPVSMCIHRCSNFCRCLKTRFSSALKRRRKSSTKMSRIRRRLSTPPTLDRGRRKCSLLLLLLLSFLHERLKRKRRRRNLG